MNPNCIYDVLKIQMLEINLTLDNNFQWSFPNGYRLKKKVEDWFQQN